MNFGLSLAHLGMLDATPPALVEAAHAAGFKSVGVRLHPARPGEVPYPMQPGGAMLRETLDRMEGYGIRVNDVEIVRIRPDFDALGFEEVFNSAEALGARFVMVNVDDDDPARAALHLAALAERARAHRMEVGVEFMVYTALRSMCAAQALVDAAGHDGVAVLVDTLHFFRAGTAPAEMSGLRVQRRFMQINDAPAVRHPGLSPAEEGRAHRLFPGEGALAIADLLQRLEPGATLSIEAPNAIRSATLDPPARAAAARRATLDFLTRCGHAGE